MPPADPSARATAAPCTVHRTHNPPATYSELHHVIPQAWQVAWQPPRPWPEAGPSPDRPGVELWDARMVTVCRTGHGNVHFWLVRTTRLYRDLRNVGEALHEMQMQARAGGLHPTRADVAVAALALERWAAAGGSVDFLVLRGLWGEI